MGALGILSALIERADRQPTSSPFTVYPVTMDASGRRPEISDGYHSAADYHAGRAPRIHRGVDILWRRRLPQISGLGPYDTRWYYAPRDPHGRPIVAMADGVVELVEARHVEYGQVTGGAVVLRHAPELASGYHHMRQVFMALGQRVRAGEVLGLMGGSPLPQSIEPRGLVHLHCDVIVAGRYVDPSPYLRGLRVLTLAEAWGEVARVGTGA